MRLGMRVSLRSSDRTVLEQIILPYFAGQEQYQKILFVGCEWYTKYYEALFQHREYWTIELDPKLRKHGSTRHVVDTLTDLNSHFEENYFDVIIYNGVFGWGINTKQDAEASFEQCFRCLRESGILVFGWNNAPKFSPFPPENCLSWHQFKPYVFPPLATSSYPVSYSFQNHTFRFLMK